MPIFRRSMRLLKRGRGGVGRDVPGAKLTEAYPSIHAISRPDGLVPPLRRSARYCDIGSSPVKTLGPL